MPETSVHPVSRQGSYKDPCMVCVCLVPRPKELCTHNQGPASGEEGCGGYVSGLAVSALPLKISKMSIVPRRVFSPSVINYYVVEKIHRLAENTEC